MFMMVMNIPTITIISVREQPSYTSEAVIYIQSSWPEVSPIVYEDCIRNCIGAPTPLPQWYLLRLDGRTIGCSGLITNDFISRADLYPWICALYVEEKHRGHAYGSLLLEKSKADCASFGFSNVYLATDHIGFYERYGFRYLAQGYHPWGEESRIYECATGQPRKF